MNEWELLAVGLVVGGAVGWLWAASRSKALQIEAEGRIRAAESAVTELRGQTQRFGEEVSSLRDKLKAEGELRVTAETRLEEVEDGDLEDLSAWFTCARARSTAAAFAWICIHTS